MISPIKLATQEQVKEIEAKSDLGPTTQVWAWDRDLAVFRVAPEIDPVHFAPTSGSQRKALFFWGLCNMLRAAGHPAVYFDIDAENTEDYQAVLEKMGAVKTTNRPQFRYKMGL